MQGFITRETYSFTKTYGGSAVAVPPWSSWNCGWPTNLRKHH